MTTQYIVIYRPHGALNIETSHIGPFNDFNDAYDFAAELPAVGMYNEEEHQGQRGVKYIEELATPSIADIVNKFSRKFTPEV